MGLRLGFLAFFGFALLFSLDLGDHFRVFFGPAENFRQMRANRLTFAIRVARQVDGFHAARRFLQIGNDLDLVGNDFVGRLKNILGGDHHRLGNFLFRSARLGLGLAFLFLGLAVRVGGQKYPDVFLGQVHHVAVRSLDQVILAQVFVDSLRLSRRFDDYE